MLKRKFTIKNDRKTQQTHDAGSKGERRERNRSYLLLMLQFGVMLVMAYGYAYLLPLVRVETVIVTFDSATGHVVKVQVQTPGLITRNEAVIQNELFEYVRNRNTVDWHDRERLAGLVRLHSSADVAKDYDSEIDDSNPKSPYNEVGPGGKRVVDINAINPAHRDNDGNVDTWQVLFKTTTTKDGGKPKVEYWSAIITYAITGKALKQQDRWENPFGFATTSYRKDQELSRHD
ncbi:virB8 family protein [Chromobacterium vaccinii]|uniref:virB8 family protein n=1 Tax=Chromobacterium vaccinii TaxID=1108595 RepID=UPI00345815D2